jgi:hypothetical protein
MIIPIDQLQSETLAQIIESFVLREGTDYGDQELSFEQKVQNVRRQLVEGQLLLVYSELHESVTILPKEQLQFIEH